MDRPETQAKADLVESEKRINRNKYPRSRQAINVGDEAKWVNKWEQPPLQTQGVRAMGKLTGGLRP